MWDSYFRHFKTYLALEKGLSSNTVASYLRDIEKFHQFLSLDESSKAVTKVERTDVKAFLNWIHELGFQTTSQARILSGLKNFFGWLVEEEVIHANPMDHIDSPKLRRKLPVVLSLDEIEAMLAAIDRSTAEGERNKAIIEILYGCGLRVSELCELRTANVYWKDEFIRVIGKGNKERLVPIGSTALKAARIYYDGYRKNMEVKPGEQDYFFLNRRGRHLSREMIFHIVKKLAREAEIKKTVSPHTFRHSFATHLVEGGADLRAVQDMLGHESITTTEIYTHLDQQFLTKTMEKFHPRFHQ